MEWAVVKVWLFPALKAAVGYFLLNVGQALAPKPIKGLQRVVATTSRQHRWNKLKLPGSTEKPPRPAAVPPAVPGGPDAA